MSQGLGKMKRYPGIAEKCETNKAVYDDHKFHQAVSRSQVNKVKHLKLTLFNYLYPVYAESNRRAHQILD